MDQTAWASSPYGEVYIALRAIEPSAPAVPVGTDAAIGRTFDFLRANRDDDALRRLETIALLVEILWQSARSGDEAARVRAHAELERLGDEWFAAGPMFPTGRGDARLQ